VREDIQIWFPKINDKVLMGNKGEASPNLIQHGKLCFTSSFNKWGPTESYHVLICFSMFKQVVSRHKSGGSLVEQF